MRSFLLKREVYNRESLDFEGKMIFVPEEYQEEIKDLLPYAIGGYGKYTLAVKGENDSYKEHVFYVFESHIIIMSDDTTITDEELLKEILKGNTGKLNSKYKSSAFYFNIKKIQAEQTKEQLEREYESSIIDLKNLHSRLIEAKALVDGLSNKYKEYSELGKRLVDGKMIYKFTDVWAEDVQGEGDDIYLGDLEVAVDFETSKVYIREGTEVRDAYSSDSRHPHEMSDTSICTGTMETDIHKAISDLNLKVLDILIEKLVHTYNSYDSAGGSWRAWTDEGMVEYVYVKHLDRDVPEEDTRWSEFYSEYLHVDYCQYSDYHNDYILDSDLRLTECGEYVHFEDEDLIEINDNYYLISSNLVTYCNIEEEYVLIEDCEQTEDDGELHLREHLVEVDGLWYLRDGELLDWVKFKIL